MPIRTEDYDNAVPITREIYWVGFYDHESALHCNPYLLIDDRDVVIFDPGSIPHFPIVMRKVIDLVNPRDISVIVASHQDPDVCGNLAVMEDVIGRTDLQIAAHGGTVRLLRHYGLNSEFHILDKNDYQLTLQSGRVLEFIHAPFLHAPGAVMTYDRKSKTLFSGDIFGALSHKWSLIAGDNFLEPMAEFHRIYMPGKKQLATCMKNLDKYDIQTICPQHGSVLEGEKVTDAVAFLKNLPCGLDLVEE